MGRKSTRRETSANWGGVDPGTGLWPVVGIGTSAPMTSWRGNPIALDIESGGVYINGIGTGNAGIFYSSDKMFKTKIDSIPNAGSIISQLKPRSFYFDTTNIYGLNFPGAKQYGLIAQDVEPILPELVASITKPAIYDSTGAILIPAVTYKALNYNAFFAILIKGIQEMNANKDSMNNKLNSRIDSLKNVIAGYASRFDTLEAMINRCCSQNQNSKTTTPTSGQTDLPTGQTGNSATQTNVQYVDLNMANAIILNQNDPNPFAEETDITYFLPETVGNATIMFYDNTGVIIKAVQLQSKGNGTLHVYASNLSSGIYTYALIADGKLIDTKKMMKTK